MECDAPQVEHRQNVRVADLVLERKSQDVEPAERREGLEAVERQSVLSQRGLEIGKRRERPLAGPVSRIHQAIQHLEPVMAHPEGVRVGKCQANRSSRGPMVLDDTVELAPHVLARGSHVGQDPRNDLVFQIVVEHDRSDSRGQSAPRPDALPFELVQPDV